MSFKVLPYLVCCGVLQCVAVWCSVLQCVTACCSVLQCVAVCCSVKAKMSKAKATVQSCHTHECLVHMCDVTNINTSIREVMHVTNRMHTDRWRCMTQS